MRDGSSRIHDVFLSYSSKDKPWADAACAVLEQHGIRCWIAPRDITPGDEWGAAIMNGLNGSRIMVLIFSGHANASGQVRREVERAISQGMTVLPVRIEDVRPEGAMEYALGNTHWLDALLIVQVALGVIAITVRARNSVAQTAVPLDSSPKSGLDGHIAGPDWLNNDPPINAKPIADSSGENKQRPTSVSNRTPPPGPARRARIVAGTGWIVEGDQLLKQGVSKGGGAGGAGVNFGDPHWADYDFTFEGRRTAGSGGFGAQFRAGERKTYVLVVGGAGNEHKLQIGENVNDGSFRRTSIRSKPATIETGNWYRIKISVRGSRIRIELDDQLLFDHADESKQRGNVDLKCWNSAAQFRNIKVSAPDGTLLWEGPPRLPPR